MLANKLKQKATRMHIFVHRHSHFGAHLFVPGLHRGTVVGARHE